MQKKRSVVVKKETIARERKKHNATIVPHNPFCCSFSIWPLTRFSPFIFGVNDYFAILCMWCTLCARLQCGLLSKMTMLQLISIHSVMCACVCVCAHLVYGICVVGQFTTIFMMAIKNCSPLLCVWNTRILYEISRTWLPMDSVLSPCLTPSHDIFWDFRCIVKLNLIAI